MLKQVVDFFILAGLVVFVVEMVRLWKKSAKGEVVDFFDAYYKSAFIMLIGVAIMFIAEHV